MWFYKCIKVLKSILTDKLILKNISGRVWHCICCFDCNLQIYIQFEFQTSSDFGGSYFKTISTGFVQILCPEKQTISPRTCYLFWSVQQEALLKTWLKCISSLLDSAALLMTEDRWSTPWFSEETSRPAEDWRLECKWKILNRHYQPPTTYMCAAIVSTNNKQNQFNLFNPVLFI